jgi:hypothetical protein
VTCALWKSSKRSANCDGLLLLRLFFGVAQFGAVRTNARGTRNLCVRTRLSERVLWITCCTLSNGLVTASSYCGLTSSGIGQCSCCTSRRKRRKSLLPISASVGTRRNKLVINLKTAKTHAGARRTLNTARTRQQGHRIRQRMSACDAVDGSSTGT